MNRMIVYSVAACSIILLSTMCDKNQSKNELSEKTESTIGTAKSVESVFNSESNLVKSAKEWIPAHDEFGSSYDTANAILSDTLKKIHYKLIKKPEGNQWPYIELICKLEGSLIDKKSIKINYTCSTPLIIKLSQSDFNDKGNKTYSHFQYIVPASDTLTTKIVNISEFTQPDWTPEASKSIPLKLVNVDAIYFTPDVDSDVGGEADLSINEFYIK